MKILFVMEKRVNAGSIQRVATYMRAGDDLGHWIAFYGRKDRTFPRLRFSTEASAFDYVVFIIESRLQWMSGLRLPRILSRVPRGRRAILDADGMYNPTIAVEGYDRNHANERDRLAWLTTFDYLADKILQPTPVPCQPGVIALAFYGYDPASQVIPTMSEGRVNLMTQRPLLRHLRFLTSKYFEIFCANTIPLVMLDPDHAESVYGPAGRELALHDGIGDKLLDVLSRPHKYREIVEQVRRHLVQHHSYQRRLQELVAALEA